MHYITLRHIPDSAPLGNEVTYIESEYNEAINAFITQHYDQLQREFVKHELTFNYLPTIYSQLSNCRSVSYYQPSTESDNAGRLSSLTTADFASLLANEGQKFQPMLIRNIDYFANIYEDPEYDTYEYMELDPDGDLSKQFHDFITHNEPKRSETVEGPVFYDICTPDICEERNWEHEELLKRINKRTERPADDTWDDDMLQALNEARQSVSKLLQSGIRETILRNLLFPEAKPSRLVVRYDYTLYLPEYNIEIELRPIERAVYVLFLSHPEGIDFKSLHDYRRELGLIYDTIAQRTNSNFSASVLDRITDPLDNSINEKCSRIKKIFLQHFDDKKAVLYYISGPQGGLKSIPIASKPDMVVWE